MATTDIGKTDSLSGFTRIAPSIYLVEPRTQSKDATLPSTIILPFWYAAPPRAAVKFVLKYAELVPSARIIFIFNGPRDFLYPTLASHRLSLKPVVDILAASQKDEGDADADADSSVYIHLFSNGGTYTTAQLLLAYKEVTGKPLRVSRMILDSAPAKSTPSLSLKALSYALPQTPVLRQIGLAAFVALIWSSYVTNKTWTFVLRLLFWKPAAHKDDDSAVYGDDPLAFSRRAVLDDSLIAPETPTESVKMCYIYSDLDDLVPLKDVEEHAALAASRKGRRVVELEKFSGSPHVGHMRAGPERYWGIVEKYLK